MKDSKIFSIVYYFVFLVTLMIFILSYNILNEYDIYGLESPIIYLGALNLILVIVFTIFKTISKKSLNGNTILLIVYLIFEAIVFAISLLYNNIVIYKNLQISYFCSIILVAYTLLNLYAILSLERKNKKKK